MKGRILRALGLVLSCWGGLMMSVSARAEGTFLEVRDPVARLNQSIMKSWSEVNMARIIAPRDAQHFHPRIIRAHLELYEILCDVVSHTTLLPHEINATVELLQGLCVSHDALCDEHQYAISFGAYHLMSAIVDVWRFAEKKSGTRQNLNNKETSTAPPHIEVS